MLHSQTTFFGITMWHKSNDCKCRGDGELQGFLELIRGTQATGTLQFHGRMEQLNFFLVPITLKFSVINIVHFNFLSLLTYYPRCLMTEDQWLTSVHLPNSSQVLQNKTQLKSASYVQLKSSILSLPHYYKFIPVFVRDSMSSEHIWKSTVSDNWDY